MATKIGSGAFTLATLQSNTLSIEIPSGTTNYSVAFVCPAYSSETMEYVIQASTQDGTSFYEPCLTSATTTQEGLATAQVNVSAIPAGGYVYVGNASSAQPWSSSTLSFSKEMATGTYDVPVCLADSSSAVSAAKILRGQTIPGELNAGNTVVFATSDETVSQAITYNNVPTGFLLEPLVVDFVSSGGAVVDLSNRAGSTTQYLALPASTFQSGDLYKFTASAYSGNDLVSVDTNTSSGGTQTFTFPASWAYAGPTAAALPSFNFNYSGFSGMSSVWDSAQINWVQGTTSRYLVELSASENYLNGATSIAVPDLSALTGFISPAASGTTINWLADISQGSFATSGLAIGSVQSVQDSGTYTEP